MKNKYLCLMISALLIMSYVTPVRAEDPELVVGGESKTFESISITDSDIGAQVDASDGGDASLNVQNDVSASCSDDDHEIVIAVAEAAGNSGTANVTVGGDIIAEANSQASTTGVDIYASDAGSANLQSNGVTSHSEEGYAYGVQINVTEDSSAEVSVGSDGINASGGSAKGLIVNVSEGSANISVGGDINASGGSAEGLIVNVSEGSANISVGGDINVQGTDNETDNYGIRVDAGDSSSVSINVAGDINTEGQKSTGAFIEASGSASVNVVTEGTLTAGSESSIVFVGNPENISLVIWKAERDAGGDIVKEAVSNEEDITLQRTTSAENLEKSINYIVKVNTEQNIELGSITNINFQTPDGSSLTYNTAKEGTQVAVRFTIPDDYELSGAFSNEEKTSELLKDESGQYYLVVPKGGGIYVNMSLVAKQNTTENLPEYGTLEDHENTSKLSVDQTLTKEKEQEVTIQKLQTQFDEFKAAQEKNNAALQGQKDALTNQKSALTKQLEATQKSLDEAVKARDTYEEKYKNATRTPKVQESPSRAQALSRNNAVGNGEGGYIAQGGHVQLNGGKSNVTFTLAAPSSGVLSSANKYANSAGGTLLHCVTTSSPGVSFKTAVVNFTVTGVFANDNIAVYQLQGKNWVQVLVTSVTDNHVTVSLTQHGPLAFVRLPNVATVSH